MIISRTKLKIKSEEAENKLSDKQIEYSGLSQMASIEFGQKLSDEIEQLKGEIKAFKWVWDNSQ